MVLAVLPGIRRAGRVCHIGNVEAGGRQRVRKVVALQLRHDDEWLGFGFADFALRMLCQKIQEHGN